MDETIFVCTLSGPILTDIRYRRQYLHERQVLLRRHLPRFREGGVDAITIPVGSVDDAALLLTELGESEGRLRLARMPSDVYAAKADGAVAVLLGVNFDAVGANIGLLDLYHHLGMAVFSLSLNSRNLLTDGCGERTQAGLSYYGIEVVRKLVQLGAIIDVSHTSDAGFEDVANIVAGPFIASHSNSRTLCDNPRNLTDAQVRTIARHGGLAGLSTYPTLIARDKPSLEGFLDHLDHFVRIVGVEHVGIGADFIDFARDLVLTKIKHTDPTGALYGDHERATPGLEGVQDLRRVATGLARRGYDEVARAKILGVNFLRVWGRVRREVGLPV